MMEITNLQPAIVWKCFHEVTQIPRPSTKEGKMIAFLENFAKKHGLAYKKDEIGNILISKPATPGMENRQTVVLQSHMDMVCEKNSDIKHDFDNDPIETIVDGEWLRANGTTLGADNGIGVAAEMAVLMSDDIEHGPIECLFTVNEEIGITGAKALQAGFMTGNFLLNLDSEDEGQIFMGCAGGKDTKAYFHYQPQEASADRLYFRIDVKGLNGGHSGGEIHKGLGNANKVLFRFLYLLKKNGYDFVLASVDGGNLRNAIAREAHAVIGLQPEDKENVRVMLNHYAADIENELKHVDKNVRLEMESVDKPAFCIDNDTARNVILSMYACPHGVVGMSHDLEGLVETSTNLASIKMKENNVILVGTSQRSSVESCKEMIADQVAAVFLLAGAEIEQGDGYPGWEPNTNSEILKVAQSTYEKLFHKKPLVTAIHAGLECGLFREKYPNLDMISFGPTLRDVHSPNERIEIKTVGMWWNHLLELLKNMPEK
mgnify:FL=1